MNEDEDNSPRKEDTQNNLEISRCSSDNSLKKGENENIIKSKNSIDNKLKKEDIENIPNKSRNKYNTTNFLNKGRTEVTRSNQIKGKFIMNNFIRLIYHTNK